METSKRTVQGIGVFLDRHALKLLLFFAVIFSVLAYIYSYQHGYALAYNDAMSHLNIARLVVDNIKPGVAQLGSVWLPLNHVLYLTLIWNDWAWHSGFAGSIFSMIAYVVSVWGMYRIVKIITGNRTAAFLGGIAFALNLNMLYLQTTPLTESLYLVFFVLSVLSFIRFIVEDDPKFLFIMGLLGFLQVLTRYDGWFVIGVEFLLIAYYEIKSQKRGVKDTIGKIIIFFYPIAFGIGLWLIWNLLIFGNPLYFAVGPYSAMSQQITIERNAGLITKKHLGISFLAYWYDIIAVIGNYVLCLAFIGIIVFYLQKKIKIAFDRKALILILLLSPIMFNILALYLGFSIINLPALNWNPSGNYSDQWFNTRYGIFAVPLTAVFIGVFANLKKTIFPVIVLATILLQTAVTSQGGIITLIDGTIGSSSFGDSEISRELQNSVKGEERILISTSFFNPVMFKTGFNLNRFIHEGVSTEWPYAIVKPEDYATWLVMPNGDVGEPVYSSLVKKQNGRFLGLYKLSYKGKHSSIYRLRKEDELFVSRNGDMLMLGKKQIEIKGVNSFDLAYKTDEEINTTFEKLQAANVNTIRFWMFGDGLRDGFQPTAGVMNEERLRKTDLIIATAGKYHIKLIPVLVNNWPEYGGKKQYLDWIGKSNAAEDLFYSEAGAKNLFKNYIDHVVSRTNSITHNPYAEETPILAWEIMNEPRTNQIGREALTDWMKDMSVYMKQIDRNHLVSVGSEQAISLPVNEGADFCSLDSIDICSVHLYLLDNTGKLLFPDPEQVDEFVAFQANYAKAIDKPVVVGEFGVSKKLRPFEQDPLEVMKNIVGSFKQNHYDGYLIWNWSLTPDNSFGFSQSGNADGQYDFDDLKKVIEGK